MKHVLQKPDFCGEAVTESWLSTLGSTVTQDQVFSLSGMNPERGMGATTRELLVALSRLGFDTGPGFATGASNSSSDLDAQFAGLHADLERQIPSIVCMHYADYAQHVMRLRNDKGRGFGLVVEPPFVVLSDSSASELRAFAERTVRFAVTRLKRDFFSKDPSRILDIWLFRESASYESNALRLFGSSPSSRGTRRMTQRVFRR